MKKDVSTSPEEGRKLVPGFGNQFFNYNEAEQTISYTNQWKEAGNIISSELTNISYEVISASKLNNLDKSRIPSTPNFKMFASKAREVSYFQFELSPIVKQNGVFKKITSFSIQYTKGVARDGNVTFSTPSVTNSVLANGEWFRFYVEKSGVYKLSRSFLSSLGMNVSSIDPRRLKIHGHGGDMLPLQNSENEYYDIPETSIRVVGGNDGSFDSQDYILFYAKAVDDEWSEENLTNLNLYANRSYYFITADGNYGKRIAPFVQPTGNATTTITTFDDYQYHEIDDYSIVKTGRRWFGDRFDVENEKEFEFTFENLITSEPVEFRINTVSASEASTSMKISVNGEELGTSTFSAITDDNFADDSTISNQLIVNSSNINVKLTYNNGGNPASLAYVDYINVKAKRELRATNSQLEFTWEDAATTSGIGEYVIQNASSIQEVWDITDLYNVYYIENTQNQSNFSFKSTLGERRNYIAIPSSNFYTPLKEANAQVDNINLKGTVFENNQGQFQDVDYVIVTSELLLQQANRLAQYRREKDDLNVKVVLTKDIYTEFNSGKQDIGAIRNFIKYIYDNASSSTNRIKYVCLFGDGSVDYKNRLQNNNNIVPVFESLDSFSTSPSTTPSDDFYGLMDANEGASIFGGKLDIAVGRILADSPQTAKILVDKIFDYESKVSYGSWRNNFVLISDDADKRGNGGDDFDLQVKLDELGDDISENQPFINVKKIHSDSYQQVSSSGGFRYPEANEAINQAVEVGACVVNYFGHGGENGLAAERLVTIESIENWQNENRYNLFVTITCDFTIFDNPLRLSPGEYNLLNNNGGSVAMVSTVRKIFVSTGADYNFKLAPYLFQYDNQEVTIAEAVRLAKNDLTDPDRRTIFYFGDPAMKLALPDPEINLTHINDIPISSPQVDTLKALSKIKMRGELVYANGSRVTNYNGILSSVIFDKRIDRSTLNNDGSGVFDFTTLGESIFRGQASVTNGEFEFEFVVPKDIKIPVGEGRVSFYSQRNQLLQDNKGYNTSILVGGINENAPEDNKGPEIQLYMNDENFVSGGITNSSPFLLAKLADENGINTASGIGHDLVAILDGDETDPFVVNDYYETEVDDYTKGSVNYKLRDLDEGLHTLTFKAWDVYNNSSTAEIQFMVTGDDELKINRVLNYPNPFTTYTEFWFNHNRPFEPLEVQVQVFTVTGKVVWTKNQVINTDGFLSRDITWDGRDDFGDRIGKGVYVYKLTVKSTLTNKKVEKFEKLVIL
ncbi:type IX secretion system sortase PorU [Mesonia maritima]|uniref:type IX secretion system sortase PorU n=1 Tax=Mesonia maritima TaxID=1793873 RepID=UPI00363BFD2F